MNTKIFFGILCLAIITSCGSGETDDKSKDANLKMLDASIGNYQTAVDDFCKCISEKQAVDCDEEFENVTSMREAIDIPLAKCAKEKALDGDGYQKIDEKITGITNSVSECIKASSEKTINEMSEENADENKDESEEVVKKPLKAPVVTEEEHHHEEEEEHHHDEPY